MVGTVTTGTQPWSVTVSGRYAYVANQGSASMQVIDISNPTSPVVVGTVTTGANPRPIAVSGRYAYVGNYGSNNMQIFDLGGEYASSLEAGTAQIGNLGVDNNLLVQGSESIAGGINVGGSANITGNVSISGGSVTIGGVGITSLVTPNAPIIANSGTAGTTTWSYKVAAVSSNGGITAASAAGSTATGNATLTATNYNTITWTAVANAVSYNIYRTAVGTSPTTTGLIGNTSSLTFNDTGLAGTTAAPTSDTTPLMTISGYTIFKNATNGLTAYSFQNASGTSLMNIDSTNSRVCINMSSCNNALAVTGNIAATGTITAGVGSPDYAENITVNDSTISGGDVVSMDPNNPEHIIKSTGLNDPYLLGVISTHPGFVTNGQLSDVTSSASPDGTQVPLALVGRVPVKVSIENGAINAGDYLTSSSVNGVAMKAISAGNVIGRAMSSFDGSTGQQGTVTLFIQNFYYSPSMPSGGDSFNNLSASGIATIGSLNVTANATINGSLTVAGNTYLGQVTITGHIITGGNTPTIKALISAGIGSTVSISGNDTTGVITINTGTSTTSGELADITFDKVFAGIPNVLIMAKNSQSASLGVYQDQATTNDFTFGVTNSPNQNTTYTFKYLVVQ